MQDVAGIQEVKEIENKIKEIGEFAFVDLSEMPLNLIKDIYITSNKIFTKYPQLKGGYGIELSEKITENGFADIISNNLSIQLNKQLFIDKKLLEKEYLKSVELNIHPKNTNYNAILIHEYGHALGEYIEKGKGISKLKIRNDVLKRAGYKTSDIEEKLSNSVSINSSEFFAEAFAEYLNSSKPRKIAKVFGQYLNEILDYMCLIHSLNFSFNSFGASSDKCHSGSFIKYGLSEIQFGIYLIHIIQPLLIIL